MRFADPARCPDCRTTLAGASVCPRCGLDLASEPARRLWQTLLRADGLLAEARAASSSPAAPAAPVAVPVAAPGPAPAAGPSVADLPRLAPRPRPAAPARRPVSGGTVLLALGALLLGVAALIFVSLAWGVLGLGGRAAIMAGITAAVAALATVLTRRGLAGAAEATWTLVLVLVTIDWFAAYVLDLAGLGAAPWVAAFLGWWAVELVLACALTVATRERVVPALRAPGVAAALVAWPTAVVLAVDLAVEREWWPSWSVLAPVVVCALTAAALHAARARAGLLVAAVGLMLSATAFVLLAARELVLAPDAVLSGATGAPLVLVAAALLVAAAVVPDHRTEAVAAGLLVLVAVVLVPTWDASPWRLSLVAAAVLALVLALVPPRADGWSRGSRLAAGVLWLGLAFALLSRWAEAANAVDVAGASALGDPLETFVLATWWSVAACAGALAGMAWLGSRWPEMPAVRPWGDLATALLAAAGVAPVLVALDVPAVVVATSSVVALAAAAPVARRLPPVGALVAVVLAGLSTLLSVGSQAGTAIALAVAAACLLGVALLDRRPPVSAPASGLAAVAAGGAVTLAVAVAVASDRAWTLAAAVLAAVLVLGALALHGLHQAAVQLAALPLASVALGTQVTLGWSALVACVLGAALVLVSFRSRPAVAWRLAGSALLGLSWVLRLLASDVDVVEAYTAPFAAVLLVAGVLALRARPELSSEAALGAGLTLALVPSLPQALEDPASWRSLALGAVALVATLAGFRQHWRAPLLAGAAVLALLALANLAPYAALVPRWLLLAVAGAVLLGVGITWDARVRDGRAVVRRVSALR